VANGDETVARRLSHTFSIQGDESQSEYWRKNADFIKADKEKRKEAAAIASFPDYFIATSPVTAPMVGIGKGIETMGEGVKEGSVPKVLSGQWKLPLGLWGT